MKSEQAAQVAELVDACADRGYALVALELGQHDATVLARRQRADKTEWVVWCVRRTYDGRTNVDVFSGYYSGYVAQGDAAEDRTRAVYRARVDRMNR